MKKATLALNSNQRNRTHPFTRKARDMQEVEFETTIEVNEVEVEVHVTAQYHPGTPQIAVDDLGRPEAVFLVTVTDVRGTDVKQYLADYELEILKAEVVENINHNL